MSTVVEPNEFRCRSDLFVGAGFDDANRSCLDPARCVECHQSGLRALVPIRRVDENQGRRRRRRWRAQTVGANGLASRRLAERLGKAPLLNLAMRLGEGTGAVLAAGILRAAIEAHNGMATFADAGVSGKSDEGVESIIIDRGSDRL